MQNSGPWDPWLPVVENSRLFAQRGHSARCTPKVVVMGRVGTVIRETPRMTSVRVSVSNAKGVKGNLRGKQAPTSRALAQPTTVWRG